MARSVMASNAQCPLIRLADSDVSTEFSERSVPVNLNQKHN